MNPELMKAILAMDSYNQRGRSKLKPTTHLIYFDSLGTKCTKGYFICPKVEI